MPWTIVNGEETFVLPPRPFELPPGMEPDTKEANAWLIERHDLFWPWWKRLMVEWHEFHKCCPRKACRRAGACCSKALACYDEAEPLLREQVYPQIRAIIRKEREGGAEAVPEPAGELPPIVRKWLEEGT